MKDAFSFTIPDLNDTEAYDVSFDTKTNNGLVTVIAQNKLEPFDLYKFEILGSFFPIVNGFENDHDYETDPAKFIDPAQLANPPTKLAYLCNANGGLVVTAGTFRDRPLPIDSITLLQNMPTTANAIKEGYCPANPQYNPASSNNLFTSAPFIAVMSAFSVAVVGFIGCAIYQTRNAHKFDFTDLETGNGAEQSQPNSGCWARMWGAKKSAVAPVVDAPDLTESFIPRMSMSGASSD